MINLNKELPINETEFDRGSIEAGLTFIPTTAFFLLLVQLITAGSFQLVNRFELQNIVTRQGLGERTNQLYLGKGGESSLNLNGEQVELDIKSLPGGGEIVMVNAATQAPRVTDFFKVNLKMNSEAIAVRE